MDNFKTNRASLSSKKLAQGYVVLQWKHLSLTVSLCGFYFQLFRLTLIGYFVWSLSAKILLCVEKKK